MATEREDPVELKRELSGRLDDFVKKYGEQFHISIPSGILPKINDYRNTYFSYLKDSEYKSNMCYLLQLIDYLLWNYKLFKPGLSLGNSYFFMLMVQMGIIAEALAHAILLDPVLQIDSTDRSLGKVKEEYHDIKNFIDRNSFAENIKLIGQLEILPDQSLTEFNKIRETIRNVVHMQNWDGRLYNSLTLEMFKPNLMIFRSFLQNLPAKITINQSIEKLRARIFDISEDQSGDLEGVITNYHKERGYGFVKTTDGKSYFFHIKNSREAGPMLAENLRVIFNLMKGRKGLEASSIRLLQQQ